MNKLKLFLILYIILLGCEYEESCTNGQKQKIDEICYECQNQEWKIIDCDVI